MRFLYEVKINSALPISLNFHYLPSLLLLLLLSSPISAFESTSITLYAGIGLGAHHYSCINLAPMTCCRMPPRRTAKSAIFLGVPPRSTTACWTTLQATILPLTQCGWILRKVKNPGSQWIYEDPRQLITGASFSFPDGVMLPGMVNRRRGSGGNGDRWTYPDVIAFNGTNYTDGKRGDLVYKSAAGNVLDLSLL